MSQLYLYILCNCIWMMFMFVLFHCVGVALGECGDERCQVLAMSFQPIINITATFTTFKNILGLELLSFHCHLFLSVK